MSVFFFKGHCIITILMSLAKKLHTRASSIWIMTETALSLSHCVLKLKCRWLLFWRGSCLFLCKKREGEKGKKGRKRRELSCNTNVINRDLRD